MEEKLLLIWYKLYILIIIDIFNIERIYIYYILIIYDIYIYNIILNLIYLIRYNF